MNAQTPNNEPSTNQPPYPTERRGGANDAIQADSPQYGISANGYSAKQAGQGGVV